MRDKESTSGFAMDDAPELSMSRPCVANRHGGVRQRVQRAQRTPDEFPGGGGRIQKLVAFPLVGALFLADGTGASDFREVQPRGTGALKGILNVLRHDEGTWIFPKP